MYTFLVASDRSSEMSKKAYLKTKVETKTAWPSGQLTKKTLINSLNNFFQLHDVFTFEILLHYAINQKIS